MSKASIARAERVLLESVGASVRRAEPGSVRLDGFAMDWTENTPRGPIARAAHVNGLSLLEKLAGDLQDGDQ